MEVSKTGSTEGESECDASEVVRSSMKIEIDCTNGDGPCDTCLVLSNTRWYIINQFLKFSDMIPIFMLVLTMENELVINQLISFHK